jgi:hypothetical protein
MWFRDDRDCTDGTATADGSTGISMAEETFFPWRSIVGKKKGKCIDVY